MRIAMIAAVRTEPLQKALARGAAIETLLTDADRARYARAVTNRRRVEFVCGRIAARCALAANGGGRVSIAHTGGLALAAASHGAIGIDVERASRELPSAAQELSENLVGWLVREAIGKLSGGGVLAPLDGPILPALVAAGGWRDHLFCIAYADSEEESDGSRGRL